MTNTTNTTDSDKASKKRGCPVVDVDEKPFQCNNNNDSRPQHSFNYMVKMVHGVPTCDMNIGGDNMEAATLEYALFTNAQRRELERQAMIYKYMVASVPIPHQLLTLDPTDVPYSSLRTWGGGGGGGGAVNMRFSRGGGDPEPWRCRRTDGKKWRCSKAVVPDHKYCERHLHRGRPRSRKAVELQVSTNNNNKKGCQNSQESTVCALKDSAAFSHVPQFVGVEGAISRPFDQNQFFYSKAVDKVTNFDATTATVSTYKDPSTLEWLMNYQQEPSNRSTVFLNEKRHNEFLDLWSDGSSAVDNTCSLSSNENFALTPLTLSIANNSSTDNNHSGLGKIEPNRNHECSGSNIPGGPLAEVLQLTENRDAVSSPSGVLPRTIASFSDSSGNSSPTTVASSSVTKTESARLWFS